MALDPRQNVERDKRSGSLHPTPSESDDTPQPLREGLVLAVNQSSPARLETHEDGYFALRPTGSQPSAPATSSVQASPTPSIASSSTTSLKLRDAVLDVSRRFSAQIDAARPPVSRDTSHASVESTDSSATVTAASPSFRPRYPNQAFSALHQQTHPPPHLPPTLRAKSLYSLHPAQGINFTSAIAALHNSGSRTTEHTPTSTTGLFDPEHPSAPVIVREASTPSAEGSYASPYLHYLHTQVPKETHVADIDVDPISGRKIINGYEIVDELGRGAHGKVKLGRSLETGHYVAIKIVERYSKKRRLGKLGNAEDKVKREVAILKKARHPNIVALLEVVDDPNRKKVYIVLERVELGEITWRAQAAKEVAMIEYRRYERESHNIFNDPTADEEDQAILDLARVRRAKSARSRLRKVRRAKEAGQIGPNVWSIELAGDSDEDSEIDQLSRFSASTADPVAEIGRLLSRGNTPTPAHEPTGHIADSDHDDSADDQTDSTYEFDERKHDPLEGTMYGSYDEQLDDPKILMESAERTDINTLSRNLSHDNLMERAIELLDADIHPDLFYVPCMSMSAIRIAFRDTVLGLQYLHYQGIIHRDIKPPNLLQTIDRRIKISDFGVSYLGRPIQDEQAENLSESDAQDFDEAKELAKTVGTAAFYAPELCYTDTTADHPPVGKAIDVWALGITLFCMLFARVPFVDSEYVVMRHIAEEEIYIPRKRLRPVDTKPKSRPSSHGRHFPITSGLRSPVELDYEPLDDSLIDLLHRLLIKDPKNRIALDEVRHHPWVVADISDKTSWLDETDANRQAQGKKIEISREDIETSVSQISIVDRLKSGFKKVYGTMTGVARSSSTKKRTPSQSGSAPSTGSSSNTLNFEGRRSSLRGDESIFNAIKASREGEHPLAQSVTASPEIPNNEPFFANTTSLSTPRAGVPPSTPMPIRGINDADRALSTMSATGSTRTIRPSDPGMEPWQEPSAPSSPIFSPSVEGSGANFSGLLTGASRLFKTVRDRSTAGRSTDGGDRFSSRASSDVEDAHADASVAVSTASASGEVNQPQALKDITPAPSKGVSPVVSRHVSTESATEHAADDVQTSAFAPNLQDDAPTRSRTASRAAKTLDVDASGVSHRPFPLLHTVSAEERFEIAEEMMMRRHIAESLEQPQSPIPEHTDHVRRECPPSPDDEIFDRDSRSSFPVSRSSMAPSLETSPASPNSSLLPIITPNTSEDRFALNPIESNPSIPSVLSADSPDTLYARHERKASDRNHDLMSSNETVQDAPRRPIARFDVDDDGYAPDSETYHVDKAVVSDFDSDDSSDDEGGLTMMRRKSMAQSSGGRSVSITNATLARYRERRGTGSSVFSKKSTRSDSSNTLMKVRSRSQGESELFNQRGRKFSTSKEI